MKMTKLKFFRLQRSLTQEEVADKLNISRGYLSQIENNQAALTDDLIIKLARLYNVNAKDLLS